MYKKSILAASVATLLLSGTAQANWKDRVDLTGFVAPTAISTSDNNFFGSTDDKFSGNYMEIGLLGKYEFSPHLSFVAEGLYKGVGESEKYPDIDFAFIDYIFSQNFNHTLGVRAGKIKTPYGLHNETRDVPFTRNRVFLPQSIYFENFRDSVFSQKGVELRGEHNYGWGALNWNAGLTKSSGNQDEVDSLYQGATDLATFDGDNSGYFRIMYTNPSADVSSAISYANIGYDVETKQPMILASGTTRYERVMYSLEYGATQNLTLTGEVEYNQWDFSQLNSAFIQNDYGLGYYVQAHYKMNNHWDTFISYGETYNDFSDRDGEEYAASSTFGIPAHQRYTKDITVGLGYHPAPNWSFRLEYSNFEGTSVLPGEFNKTGPTHKYWDMVSFQAAYRLDIL
jgi:hypothetical protein